VLNGIGAAFRLDNHLSTQQAVVLQAPAQQLWYQPFLVPGRHYIPLAQDLSNISAVLQWVADNPVEVRRIAAQGHQFYNDHLSEQVTRDGFLHMLESLASLPQE